MHANLAPARIWTQECPVCKQQRASKKRVLDGTPISFSAEQIERARAVFATNAVKYHVNKLRAQEWAQKHGQTVQSCQSRLAGETRSRERQVDVVATPRPRLRRAIWGFALVRRRARDSN